MLVVDDVAEGVSGTSDAKDLDAKGSPHVVDEAQSAEDMIISARGISRIGEPTSSSS